MTQFYNLLCPVVLFVYATRLFLKKEDGFYSSSIGFIALFVIKSTTAT